MKRIVPWLTALCLPLLIGAGIVDLGSQPAGAAPAPSGWDPDVVYAGLNQTSAWENDGFEALPDFERDSAKFLVLSGPSNNTLAGFAEGRTQLILNFPADQARHRVAIFDPNTEGLWDQRVDGKVLLQRPTVHYYLFADGGDTVRNAVTAALADPAYQPGRALPLSPALTGSLVRQISSEDVRTFDNEWCGFVDVEPQAAALRPDGSYQYFFVAILGVLNPPPAPSTPAFEGTEACGYKIAWNGTYLLPAGSVIGFGGGVIDKRTLVGSQDTLILSSYDPLAQDGNPAGGQPIQDRQPPFTENPALPPNAFDGKFNFHFHSTQLVCNDSDLQYYEADADWNRIISRGDANTTIEVAPDGTEIIRDEAPTGLPADNGLRYRRTLLGTPDFPYRDSTPYRMGTQVRWFAFPIGGAAHSSLDPTSLPVGTPSFASNVDAPSGHASVDVSFQPTLTGNGGGDPLTENGAFQVTTFGKATVEQNPGLWCIRWDGVDQGNFIFIKAQLDIGTTPLPCDGELRGTVFCDNDGDCEFSQGDTPILNPVTGLPTSVQVRITPTNPAGTPVIVNTDAATGAWSYTPAPFGEYSVEVVPGQAALANLVLSCPTKVDVTLNEQTPDFVLSGIDLGYGCPVEVRGRIWCDDNQDGLFGSEEAPLPGWRVDAFPLNNGVPAAVAVATATSGVDGTYSFGNQLVPGNYRIQVRYPDAPITDGTTPVGPLFSDVTLVAGAGPSVVNFTFLCPTSVEGRIWCDDDKDGIFDLGETPLAGLTVEARPTIALNGPAVASTTTGADGTYNFGNQLTQGSFRIQVLFPNPPLTDGVGAPISPLFQDVTLTLANTPQVVNFTFECPVTVNGRVWCDDIENGRFDLGETPLAGWTVEARLLTNLNGPALATTTTGVDGTYTFGDQLTAGSYRISILYPNPPITDGVSAPISPLFQDVTLTVGGQPAVVNFTFKCPVTVNGRVWCDDNENGRFDLGETPLAGWTVEARPSTNLAGPAIATTTSGVDGTYTFGDQLSAGSYRISILFPNAPLTDVVSGPISPLFQDVTLTFGGEPTIVNFTFECPVTVNGRVWCDDIENGRFDAGENPLAGWTVEARPQGALNGPAVATAITGVDGTYSFGNQLTAGAYRISVLFPNPPITDDASAPISPLFQDVVLTVGAPPTVVNFTFKCPVTVTGRIWCDLDEDGIFDAGETPLANMTVEARPTTAVNGPAIASTTSGIDGTYSFGDQLVAGSYRISIVFPNPPTTDGATPLSPLFSDVTLTVGGAGEVVNFTFECPGSIRGRVYCTDICPVGDYNPQNPGDRPLPGILVELLRGAQVIDTDTTDANGFYNFEQLDPGTYQIRINGQPTAQPDEVITGPFPTTREVILGDRQDVTGQDFGYCCQIQRFCDIRGLVFCDRDCDGQRVDGDPGLQGIRVILRNDQGAQLDETTTDVNGAFSFLRLPLATYNVEVDETTLPAKGRLLTTNPFTVICSERVLVHDVEFAVCKLGDICGTVFEDPKGDCDGILQPGDRRVEGVTVLLKNAAGQTLDSRVTGADGTYCFLDLEPGTYIVEVQEPFDAVRILTLVTSQSVTVELEPEEVETVDFGLCAQDVCGRVWRDEDCDQNFEPGDGDRGIGNIEVTIVGIAGTALDLAYTATTTTDADGFYCFRDVPPGQLEVRVADSVGNTALLVDLDPQDPTFYTPNVQVGEVVDGLDFIYCPKCDPSKICVKVFGERKDNCDGRFDDGDLCLEYVQVFLGKPGGPYIKWAFTDKDGKVCFEDLEPGEYEVYVGANQRVLENWELCSENCVKVMLGKCECLDLEFCYCEKCPEIPCCEGNLHEVVVDALVWVGDTRKYEIEATLFRDCKSNKVKGEAAVEFMRNMGFPGAVTGLNDVITIEDVQAHRDGHVVVTLRIKASAPAFPKGHFGNAKRRLLLRVNDCYHEACMRWRCETMKDGVIFGDEGASCDCSPFDCKTWSESWATGQFGVFYSADCGKPFVVRDVTNYATYRGCNPCEPTYEKKDFTACFPIGDPDMDHVLRAKIVAGGKTIDELVLRWTGHSWEGELKGRKGLLKVGRVWHDEERCEMCAEFCITYQCGCPEPGYDLPSKVKFIADLHEAPAERVIVLECDDDGADA